MVSEKLQQEVKVEGIGSGTPSCRRTACISGVLPDGGPCTFKAPVLEEQGAGVPALLGRRALVNMNAILDVRANRVILPGPGEFSMSLSPGTRVLQCQESPSGHMILHITGFDRKDDKVDGVALQTAAGSASDSRPRLPEPKAVVSEAVPRPLQFPLGAVEATTWLYSLRH